MPLTISDWKPIAIAPQDGSDILVVRLGLDEDSEDSFAVVHWVATSSYAPHENGEWRIDCPEADCDNELVFFAPEYWTTLLFLNPPKPSPPSEMQPFIDELSKMDSFLKPLTTVKQ